MIIGPLPWYYSKFNRRLYELLLFSAEIVR